MNIIVKLIQILAVKAITIIILFYQQILQFP